MNEPEFVDELPYANGGGRGRKPGEWMRMLEPLMNQPGRWAIVARKQSRSVASTTAQNLRQRIVRIPTGQWEFASRTVDGEARVYARYLGNGQVESRC